MLHLALKIKPEPKLRPRWSKSGPYTPGKTRKFEDELRLLAKTELPKSFEMYTRPIEVKLIFHLPRPKRIPKSRTYPAVKPDLDNLIKSACDALNGVVWKDDALIYSLTAVKLYAPEPAILLYVFD